MNECISIEHNYSPHVGTQPSPTATSPRSCPSGQFSCPPPGGCIASEQRCDGIPHCPRGEDESGCHPYNNITTQSDRWREMVLMSSYVSSHVVITTLYQCNLLFIQFFFKSLCCKVFRYISGIGFTPLCCFLGNLQTTPTHPCSSQDSIYVCGYSSCSITSSKEIFKFNICCHLCLDFANNRFSIVV